MIPQPNLLVKDRKLSQANEPILEMRGIVKKFPGVVANAGVDFDLRKGEIHTLLGENGAGKTTLMNVLYGLYEPEEGEILLNGKPIHLKTARDAIALGLGMVHQHFMLVQRFTVAENIILGQHSPREPRIEDQKAVYARLKKLSDRYCLSIHPEAEVWTLSVGEQQRVEILKALYRGAEILILDEPTAVLTPQEAEQLLEIIRVLTQEGKSVVFISHKLNEVLAVSDRITVLRDGKVIDTVQASQTGQEDLACKMVGREVLLQVSKTPAQPKEAVLVVDGVSANDDRELQALYDVGFEVKAGEILGIAGVAGNGQSELEQVIAGLRPATSGTVTICGENVTNAAPKEVGCCGLAHIPSDRYRMGVLSDFTIAENLVLQRIGQKPFTRRGWLNWKAIRQQAEELVKSFDVRTPSIEMAAGKLSGGNAQKMILARELARQPRVLISAQPTRGLDVSAIEYVHRQLIAQRDAGVAILLFSTELQEILTLSDRIAVMYEGRIVGVMDIDQADINELGLMMAGGKGLPPCEILETGGAA
jgi:general nucleoside transport system ATP-binding protein